MKEDSHQHNPSIDPVLEARIVALVLGEASDFERDELNRLIAEHPELAAFKEQAQYVHGLLQDVGTGEMPPEDADWKLPSEKRVAVIAAFNGETVEPSSKSGSSNMLFGGRVKMRRFFWSLTAVAALLCIVGLFVQLPISYLQRAAHFRANVRAETSEYASDSPWDEAAATDDYVNPDAEIFVAPDVSARGESEADSKSSLWAIQETLGFGATMEGEKNTPESAPQQAADGYAAPSSGVTVRSSESSGIDGGRVAGSSRSEPATESYQLALPELPDRFERFDTSDARDHTVNAPDHGTVLLGGMMGGSMGSRKKGNEPSDSSRVTKNFFESKSGIETIENKSVPALGIIPERQSSTRFGYETFGRDKLFPQQPSSQSEEDVDFAVQNGVVDPQAVEADDLATGGIVNGRGVGGGGFAGESLSRPEVTADAPQRDNSVTTWMDSGLNRESEEARHAKSLSSQPGRGGRPIAEGESSVETYYDSRGRGTLNKKNKFVAPNRGEEEVGKGLASKLDDIALPAVTDFEDGGFYYQERLTESAVPPQGAVPNDGRQAGQSLQEKAFGDVQFSGVRDLNELRLNKFHRQDFDATPSYQFGVNATAKPTAPEEAEVPQDLEQRAKESLGKISTLNSFDSNADVGGVLSFGDHDDDAPHHWAFPDRSRQTAQLGDESPHVISKADRQSADRRYVWGAYVPPTLKNNDEWKKRALDAKKPTVPTGLDEKKAADDAFSTFSLHVSDVSFKLAQAALARGEWPEAAKIRVEEFVNAFDYGDPMPSQSEKVSCCLEQSVHPFLQQRNVLRVAMRTAAAGRSNNTPLRLTLLLDNSGSMERVDRQQTVRRAFAALAEQLKPIDQVTLISFARQPRLLADKVSGAQSAKLVQLVRELPSEGGTNIEAALQLAMEKAQEHHLSGAQNRIILLTDGAVNLGDAEPNSLSEMIISMRNVGIAFDAAGISAEGLNDEILEALTRQGDGRYYLLDSAESVEDGFARQIAGALRPSAKNVKVQVEFNPKRVGRYKLLGFEKHRLKKEDFRNDKVDAAEMAAAEAGVAMYQFEAKPDGEGDVGSVSVRFRDLATGNMVEHSWPIPYDANASRLEQAAPSLRIATSASLLAAKLRGGSLGEVVDLKDLDNLVSKLPEPERNFQRVQQLQMMIQQARQISGK